MTVLCAQKLAKHYEGGPPVIRSLDLTVEAGDFLVIMGSSGSGKSTLLYLLSGLDSPNEGSVEIQGTNISGMNEHQRAVFRRRSMGFVFQDFNLIGHLSVLQNVTVPGSLTEPDAKKLDAKARTLLDTLGIADLADRRPAQISGGEAQRCAVARSLVNEPALIFADEPTGNLNSASASQLLDELERLNAGGQTIVMVTHELKTACRGKKVIFLKDGAVLDSLTLQNTPPGQDREEVLFNWLKKQGW